MFVISPITSSFPLLPSSLQHMFPCSSALFFPILRFSSPCHRVCFLNSSFWVPFPPSTPPALLLFTPATHLSQSIRPRSGHPAITLHYRHIQHTNFTQRSTWGVPLLCSYWSKQNSPRPLLVATPRGLAGGLWDDHFLQRNIFVLKMITSNGILGNEAAIWCWE